MSIDILEILTTSKRPSDLKKKTKQACGEAEEEDTDGDLDSLSDVFDNSKSSVDEKQEDSEVVDYKTLNTGDFVIIELNYTNFRNKSIKKVLFIKW